MEHTAQQTTACATAAQRLLAGLLCVALLLAGMMAHVPSLHEALHHHDCHPHSDHAGDKDPGCDLCVLATCATTPAPNPVLQLPAQREHLAASCPPSSRGVPAHPELARPRTCGPPAGC